MRIIIDSVREDIKDLEAFYNINFSTTRINRLHRYLEACHLQLTSLSFHQLDSDGRADYVLLRKYLTRQVRGFQAFEVQHRELTPVIEPFAGLLVELLERRAKVLHTDWTSAAGVLSAVEAQVRKRHTAVQSGALIMSGPRDRFAAHRAVGVLLELRLHLTEYFEFYKGYDPLATWWLAAPYKQLERTLQEFADLIRERLVGLAPGDEDAIVGQPVGRDTLLEALESNVIVYSPEECISIAEKEYAWSEKEMIEASTEMGLGKDWKAAVEHVKNMYVPPGEQTHLVQKLSAEAVDYVQKHDLVTIPRVAEEAWRTTMMTPERQTLEPSLLGGSKTIVSSPTETMSHYDKLLSLRANSEPFLKSTVFHELLPGHHLQHHCLKRHNTHRQLFSNTCWMEGWACAWDMNLYARGFPGSAADRIAFLVRRMHQCARTVFSLSFHLGTFTPQQCIDYLVEKVGHDLTTAEGEVRRSFNGDYGPLYPVGYMLGGIQFRALRREMVEERGMLEQVYHDIVLKAGPMAIEILRALLQGTQLKQDHTTSWRFADL